MTPMDLEQQPEGVRPGELPLPADGLGSFSYWKGEVQSAKDQKERLIGEWRKNIRRYMNKPHSQFSGSDTTDIVWVPKDFALTERKRAKLWYQLPEVYCQPKPGQMVPPMTGPVFAAVMNQYLADECQVDAQRVMREVTFDQICPAGIMVSKLGYEAFVDGERQVPGMVDPFTGVQQVDVVPNIVKERYYWHRVSPARLLLPADWTGSNYDDAPWVGMEFERDRETVKRLWNLTDEELPNAVAPEKSLNELEDMSSERANRRVVRGIEVYYKASLFDANVKHPDRIRWMVFLDKDDKPVIHRDSPDQTVTPEGALTADSLYGFPIHVGSIRYVSDSKYPSSDVQQSSPQVFELSRGRSQMVAQRDRSIPMRWGDRSRLDPDTVSKLTSGDWQAFVLTDGPGNEIVGEVARAQYPRESFEFNAQIEKDLEETWSLGSNQLGIKASEGQTATEASITQSNSAERLGAERQEVVNYFIGGVKKIATLIQRYADAPDYVQAVGPQGEQILQQWDKTQLSGKYLWSIKPDSQLRLDMGQERQYRTQVYNLLRKDPLINPQELIKWVLESYGMTHAAFLAQPQPPSPPPPKISLTFKGEDLNPFAPQYANITQILAANGGPQLQPPQPLQPVVPHGGQADKVEPIDKHQAEATGNLPGAGKAANVGNV